MLVCVICAILKLYTCCISFVLSIHLKQGKDAFILCMMNFLQLDWQVFVLFSFKHSIF